MIKKTIFIAFLLQMIFGQQGPALFGNIQMGFDSYYPKEVEIGLGYFGDSIFELDKITESKPQYNWNNKIFTKRITLTIVQDPNNQNKYIFTSNIIKYFFSSIITSPLIVYDNYKKTNYYNKTSSLILFLTDGKMIIRSWNNSFSLHMGNSLNAVPLYNDNWKKGFGLKNSIELGLNINKNNLHSLGLYMSQHWHLSKKSTSVGIFYTINLSKNNVSKTN